MPADGPISTFRALIDAATALIDMDVIATPEESTELRAVLDRLLAPAGGTALDFSDPANSGLLPGL